jgi:hypothetical protein
VAQPSSQTRLDSPPRLNALCVLATAIAKLAAIYTELLGQQPALKFLFEHPHLLVVLGSVH